jgi:multicomponent Na+:H+ antiporter subunit E
MRKPSIDLKAFIFVSVLLFCFWFLMSPELTVRNFAFGIFSACGITYYWRSDLFERGNRMGFNLRQVYLLGNYLLHLVYNVILANIHVAMIVLNPRLPVSPGFIQVKTKLEYDLPKFLYANSITLTPGTITVNLKDDRLLIHAITEEAARDVCDWYMQDKLREIEVSGK